jgi:hypothetical protein
MSKKKKPEDKPGRGADAGAAEPCSEADWTGKCEACGASPIVPETGMCGPCTFGEAETAGGDW